MDSKATNAGRKRLEGNRRGDDEPNRLHTSSKQFLNEARLQESKHNGFEFIWGPCFSVDVSFVLVLAIHTMICLYSLMRIYLILHVSRVSTAHEKYYVYNYNMSIIHPSIYPSKYLSIHHHPPTYVYISMYTSVCLSFHNQLVYLKIY